MVKSPATKVVEVAGSPSGYAPPCWLALGLGEPDVGKDGFTVVGHNLVHVSEDDPFSLSPFGTFSPARNT